MSHGFDPYYVWLGISPKHQPPDHYRLLGIDRFESDVEVICEAAERQIAHVRRKSIGRFSDVSQRILNELAAARECLVDTSRRAAYDAALQAIHSPPAPPPLMTYHSELPPKSPARIPPAIPTASPVAWHADSLVTTATPSLLRRKRTKRLLWGWVILFAILVFVLICTVLLWSLQPESP